VETNNSRLDAGESFEKSILKGEESNNHLTNELKIYK